MATDEVEGLLARLEVLTYEVLARLTRGEVADLIELVAEQCHCVDKLAGCVSTEDAERLRKIVRNVTLQQQLVQQGLEISRSFLDRLYQKDRFQGWA
ncbi:hypothetical protein [Alicyclobacillus acidocaldarius]|uniref:Flagellar protein FliT n=1 Tax=Alicyclobacillus acidocaldarius subsp. acidocaldarius (strain ATCC 27009 / DSM 446 / BCRC 14685 / JCM 5260 / KCTC 1825 / NBRC 15652 / NCIMB 11725 / NRRL B-14509 / 104-IA) TaxID=521098 RepID=C8WT53_ALIAD|nr:hypothetical protein [Alicyclobacillus acidocaldarius]ACV59568.1 hypothetical protein Aaci_2564 [Alicyclobacillus acidocaldarius subsp. acidocaldarius DSM 446]